MSSEKSDHLYAALNEMSEDDLLDLEIQVNESEKDYLTREDCIVWAFKGYWTVWEAVFLINNLDSRRCRSIIHSSQGHVMTRGARLFDLFNGYLSCLNDGSVAPRTVINREAFEHGIEDKRDFVVLPSEFLLWAKSKGLPVPPMLWSAVFTPGEFALEGPHKGNVEILVDSPISSPPALAVENKQTSDCSREITTVSNQHKKDPVRQADAQKNYPELKEFKKRIGKFILEEKNRECNCNHLRLAEYLKKIWPSLKKQLFENKDPWKIDKHKEPTTYFIEICRKTYADCHKNISLEEKNKKWRIVKRMNTDAKKTPICPIPQHNEF